MLLLNDYAPLLLRICLVVLFPFSALDKVVNWNAAMKQAGSVAIAPALLVAGIVVELITPICIVAGWHDRLAAFVLAGFCAVTAVLYHQFWRFPDFWRFKEGEGLEHFWEFLKNFGLVGGLGTGHAGATHAAGGGRRAAPACLDLCQRARRGRRPARAGLTSTMRCPSGSRSTLGPASRQPWGEDRDPLGADVRRPAGVPPPGPAADRPAAPVRAPRSVSGRKLVTRRRAPGRPSSLAWAGP